MKNKKRGGRRAGAGRPQGQGKYGIATKPIRIPENLISEVIEFIEAKGFQIPLFSSKISAGFPSPADDFIEDVIDLNRHLVKHPTATFLLRVSGDSMIDAGIHPDDILVVDRSLPVVHGKVVIAVVDNNLTVKRFFQKNNKILLLPENKKYKPIEISDASELTIWGVVTNVIHSL